MAPLRKNILTLLCVLLAGFSAASYAQTRWAWHGLHWQGSNKQFEKAKSEIRSQIPPLSSRKNWISGLRWDAGRSPNDALAQFKYAYAWLVTTPEDKDLQVLDSLRRMLNVNPPYTREYCWLLFQIEFYHCPSPKLISVARRLLREMPNDLQLTWQLAVLLSDEPDLKLRREAFALTGKTVKARPKDAGLRFIHAMRAYRIYIMTETRADAKVGLAAFEDYLRIAPDDHVQHDRRVTAKRHMSMFTLRLNRLGG